MNRYKGQRLRKEKKTNSRRSRRPRGLEEGIETEETDGGDGMAVIGRCPSANSIKATFFYNVSTSVISKRDQSLLK